MEKLRKQGFETRKLENKTKNLKIQQKPKKTNFLIGRVVVSWALDPTSGPAVCTWGLHRGLLWPGPGWGPVRVGARSGLGPIWALMGPYMGPCGPLWVRSGHVRFPTLVEFRMFRVQTAPFDKITTDFWRSRRRLYIPDLLKAKKLRRQIIIF